MAAVLETELYEVSLPEKEQVAFTPSRDGLPIFHGKTYEDHLEAWIHVSESVECRKWALGAIAASLEKKHGDGAMKQLSKDTGTSKTRVYEYAKTYRAFQNSQRSERLSFHHHTVAAEADDPTEAITRAEVGRPEGGMWSTRELERYIETGLEPGETSGIDADSIADVVVAESGAALESSEDAEIKAMLAHLIEAQEALNTLKAKCPQPKFVTDVYESWLSDIADYLEQLALTGLKDKVILAWRAGKYQETEIAALTGIPGSQIHAVMKAYERDGIFQKIQRRKTDKAKGTRPWIWHLAGEPVGSDYERVQSGYQPHVEYGDEGEEHF